MRRKCLVAAAAVLMVATLGVAAATPVDTRAAAPSARPSAQEPDRRALLVALASLAGVTPPELRAAVERHGGLLSALQTLGVTQRQLLDLLIQRSLDRLQPAIDQGRLSPAQAEQLARQRARRALRRLGGMTPPGR